MPSPVGRRAILVPYLAELARLPLLDVAAERSLAERARTGDRLAQADLAAHNTRLVVRIARSYAARGCLMPIEDLIGWGNVGLMRATRDFDPATFGTRFSTYASRWIRESIRRAIYGDGIIRIPFYVARRRAPVGERGVVGDSLARARSVVSLQALPPGFAEPAAPPEPDRGLSADDILGQLRRTLAEIVPGEHVVYAQALGLDRPRLSIDGLAGRLGLSRSRAILRLGEVRRQLVAMTIDRGAASILPDQDLLDILVLTDALTRHAGDRKATAAELGIGMVRLRSQIARLERLAARLGRRTA